MTQSQQWTRRDILHVVSMLSITILFSVRTGPFQEVVVQMATHLWAYAVYSVATVLIIIGITKKMFKYKPTRIQIIKWAAALAALCAVTEFFHEAYMIFSERTLP